MAESPPDLDSLPADLKSHVVQLLEEDARLNAEMAALREELAPLKGLKGPARKSARRESASPVDAARKASRPSMRSRTRYTGKQMEMPRGLACLARHNRHFNHVFTHVREIGSNMFDSGNWKGDLATSQILNSTYVTTVPPRNAKVNAISSTTCHGL
jgi:hypothetical protein